VNLLRPYDVSSNSFSINQASFIVEHLPTTTERLGGRIDLQFGQATETLQGSSVNEERPQVWRNLFQVYGSYLAPVGREHIFDTYATSNAIPRLTLVGEADFVVNRTYAEQRPGRVVIGSLAARYALPHQWNAGARAEYLDDRGGLFSGTTQALKEVTLVADHTFPPGFLARAEYRRDFSNQRFFLTDTPGALIRAQTTATLGLMYWWGTKQGSW
jgi:hypothetical protein